MKISSENKVEFLSRLLIFIFGIQKYLVRFIEVNKPETGPCIYSLWHGQQCGLYGSDTKDTTSVLVSKSVDGQIIANAIESLGMKSIRGSKGKKGAVEGTMQMISKLKENENVAITVDGPRGPAGVVKNGVIKVAKLSQCPIVPLVWYSSDFTFIKFPSWDKFCYPLTFTRTILLYGEPIYIGAEASEEEEENFRLQLQTQINNLEKQAPKMWKKAWKHKLWIWKNEKINI